jgi:hypothetical protein
MLACHRRNHTGREHHTQHTTHNTQHTREWRVPGV